MLKTIQEIYFEKVNFSYSELNVYNNSLNFSLHKNNIYLLDGKNGAGKTTLIGILLKIWSDYKGEIYINKSSLKSISREEMVNNIGVMFQRVPIFRDTIRNNITLGISGDLKYIITELNFDKDLEEMGRTLDSEVFDTSNLSGGQAQKVGILRAIFMNKSVYIFDEPTANLDAKSKERFLKLLESIKSNRIIILISHDKEISNAANRIIKL